jgi:hypothetical protein
MMLGSCRKVCSRLSAVSFKPSEITHPSPNELQYLHMGKRGSTVSKTSQAEVEATGSVSKRKVAKGAAKEGAPQIEEAPPQEVDVSAGDSVAKNLFKDCFQAPPPEGEQGDKEEAEAPLPVQAKGKSKAGPKAKAEPKAKAKAKAKGKAKAKAKAGAKARSQPPNKRSKKGEPVPPAPQVGLTVDAELLQRLRELRPRHHSVGGQTLVNGFKVKLWKTPQNLVTTLCCFSAALLSTCLQCQILLCEKVAWSDAVTLLLEIFQTH